MLSIWNFRRISSRQFNHGAMALISGISLCLLVASQAAALEYKRLEPLLETGETIIGQTFVYPQDSPAEVTAVIVTMLPGEETGWHIHEVPLFGYVLEGELTVDYGAEGKKTYKVGDTLMEALNHPHNGVNTGTGVMRILAVFMSSENGVKTKPVEEPAD
ncbi:cupin domain-containing protein [Hoeflea sp. CAU 1731]